MIKKLVGQIKSYNSESSKYGSEVTNYSDLGKVRGFLGLLTVEKGTVGQKIVEDSTHIFICDTRLDIKQGDRLIVKDTEYEVNFVDRPDMSKRAQIELKVLAQQMNKLNLPIYFGSTNNADVIETDVVALESQEMKTKSFSKEINTPDNYLVIAYPKTFGKSSIRLDNKPAIDWDITELMINGRMYYVYKKETTEDKTYIELF